MAKDKKKLNVFGVVFLGLGGIIGSAYFLASGIVIRQAGPAVVVGFILGAVLVYRVMTGFVDLVLNLPRKETFRGYLEEVLGPTMGFVIGWNTWLSNLVAMSSEVVAMGIFSLFWFPHVPLWVFTTVYGTLAGLINLFGLSGVDEVEEGFSAVKMLSLLGFAGLAAFILGSGRAAAVPVFRPGAFFPHGITGLGQAMLIITFALGGVVTLGVTAGKTENPRTVLPRAALWLAAGQAALYAIPALALVWVIPWQDVSTQVSPFILGLKHMGLGMFGTAFNVAILSASLSLLIGSMFSGIVIMVSLSRAHEAPSFLARKANRRKMHVNALAANTVALVAVSFITYFLPKTVYGYVTMSAGFFSILMWLFVLTGHMVLLLRKKGRVILPVSLDAVVTAVLLAIVAVSLRAHEQRIAILFPVVFTALFFTVKTWLMKPRGQHPGGGGSLSELTAGVLRRLKMRI